MRVYLDPCSVTLSPKTGGTLHAELLLPSTGATEATLYFSPGIPEIDSPTELLTLSCSPGGTTTKTGYSWITTWEILHKNELIAPAGPLQVPRYVFTRSIGQNPFLKVEYNRSQPVLVNGVEAMENTVITIEPPHATFP